MYLNYQTIGKRIRLLRKAKMQFTFHAAKLYQNGACDTTDLPSHF